MSSMILLPRQHRNLPRLEEFIKPKAGAYTQINPDTHPDISLILWSAERDTTALYVPMDDGGFVAIAGTFFYGDIRDTDAANAFYQDFDAATFDWRETSGQFMLAISKQGKLSVFNDGLAAWKLYRDTSGSYVSAGFLEALLLTDNPSFDTQGVYEFAFAGFSLGRTTFVSEILAVMPNRLLTLLPDGRFEETELPTPIRREKRPSSDMKDIAAWQLDVLKRRFDRLSSLAPNELTSSVSGGFDSRLMIGMFTRLGLKPNLFVYGPDHDPDVAPSKAVADYLGLPLRHVNRNKLKRPTVAELPNADDVIFLFDGWKDDGLMGFDLDVTDRATRVGDARYMANGKCGEIYRHYYYQRVPKRGINLRAQVNATFGRVTPQIMPDGFDRTGFQDHVEQSFRAVTGFTSKRMSEQDLDYLYSKVRICHDAGRDIVINHRFSNVLYPFVEAELSGPALNLNYAERIHGRVEAHMLAQLDPALTALPSAYGYDLIAGPGLSYRIKMALSYHRPMWLRAAIPALKTLFSRPGSGMPQLVDRHLLTDTNMPYMQRLFRLDNVRDPSVASRLYALELLGQRFNFR